MTAFERLVLPALDLDQDVVWVIDELGKMELASQRFQQQIIELVDTEASLLATVHRHDHPFTDRLKTRPDIRLIEMTQQKRDRLPSELVNTFTRSG